MTVGVAAGFRRYDMASPSNLFDDNIILEIIHTARGRSYETNAATPNTITASPRFTPVSRPHRIAPRLARASTAPRSPWSPVPRARKSTRTNMAASSLVPLQAANRPGALLNPVWLRQTGGPRRQKGRQRHLLGARDPKLGRGRRGRPDHPTHLNGGHGHLSRRQPRPAGGHRRGFEPAAEGAVQPLRQQDIIHFPLQHAQGAGFQRVHFRGQKGAARKSTCTPGATTASMWKTAAPSALTRTSWNQSSTAGILKLATTNTK
jgi:hypothetical protein